MSANNPRRAYNVSTAAMIVGIGVITESAIAHADELSLLDTNFNESFFRELRGRINVATKRLGADNASELRAATDRVEATAEQALTELRLVKLWIEGRFSNEPVLRDELLTRLGFATLYRNASKSQQADLHQLLLRFNENMTAELSRDFIAKGLPATRLDKIRQLGEGYHTADAVQERQKKERGELTEADVLLFNSLYLEVIGIAKMARKLFADRPAIQAGFVFEKTAPGARRRSRPFEDPTAE